MAKNDDVDQELLAGDSETESKKAAGTPEDEGVEALKARVDTAKRQREADRLALEESTRRATLAAEETARLRQEAQAARQEAASNRVDTVAASIDSLTREAEMAQAKFEKAAMDGDYKAQAAAQREISRAEARLVALEQAKAVAEADAKARPQQQRSQVANTGDPVERYISNLTPQSAVWLRQRKELMNSNGTPTEELVAVHTLAVRKGIQPDTDQYFAFLERKLDALSDDTPRKRPETDDEEEIVVETPQRRSVSMAAPVSRSSIDENTSPTRIKLTKEELEAADVVGMSPAEYAKAKLDPNTKALLQRTRH